MPNKHTYNSKLRRSRNPYSSGEEQEMPGRWLDYGFRFYDSQIARFHSVDPLAHSFSSQSPYVYAGNNPILNIDFMGLSILNYAMNLKGRNASDVELTNEQWMASTRPEANPSLQRQFIMQNRQDYFNSRQIEAALNNPLQLQNLGYSGYYTMDNNGYIVKHYIDGIGAFYWSRSPQSGGGSGNPVQTASDVNNYTGIFISAADQVIKNTKFGSNIAYAISGNSNLVSVVSKGLTAAPYVGLFVTIGTGYYLSRTINPATNQPYQSWFETGTDIGANLGIIYIGAQFGGWWGAGAAAVYLLDKAAFKAYIEECKKGTYEGIPKYRR